MQCGNCPGLNRSYMACSQRVRSVFLIGDEIDCPRGEGLAAKRAEEGKTARKKPLERTAGSDARAR